MEFLANIFRLQHKEDDSSADINFYTHDEEHTLYFSSLANDYAKGAVEIKVKVFDSQNKLEFERQYIQIGNREIHNNNFYSINEFRFFDTRGFEHIIKLLGFGIEKTFNDFLDRPFSVEFYDEQIVADNFYFNSGIFFKILDKKNAIFNETHTKVLELPIQTSFTNTLSQYSPIKNVRCDLDNSRVASISNANNEEISFTIQNVRIQFLVGDKWLDWGMLSDGTKRIFYLIFNILLSEASYSFIEEPELGIHPDQLYKLIDFLKEQSKEKQIILTTHSPEVLNILSNDELDRIIVTRYDAEKGTQMRKMNEKQIEKAKRYMSKAGLFVSDYWVHSNLEEATYETEEN